MSQTQPSTLGAVIEALRAEWQLSGLYDFQCKFDGRRYSLLNLRNYLSEYLDSPARLTEGGNIRWHPPGSPKAALIHIQGGDKETDESP